MGTDAGTGKRGQLTPLDRLRANVQAAGAAPAAMGAYLAKVHLHAYRVTDEDIDALKAAGFSEDETFEQTVAAAISEGLYRLDAAENVL